jgi:hypothetical protein
MFGIAFHFAIERPLLKASRRLVVGVSAARASRGRASKVGPEVAETM